jgi:hypothetical protein
VRKYRVIYASIQTMTTAQSYHNQSVAAQALAPLNTLSASLDTIQQALQTSTTYSALSAATNNLLTADDTLSSALQLLHRQQANHARILTLQAEVQSLESQIRDTISRARSIRKDITSIHPSIDDESDESEDEAPEVDYQQLLNFAARIGKHNAVAKLEAEQQGERLKLEAHKARKKSEAAQASAAAAAANTTTDNGIPIQSSSQQLSQDPTSILDKIDREAAELSARSAAWHSFSRLPFPAPDILRMGALGNLQHVRESDPGDPEGAAEREAEKLVRESEEIAPDEGIARRQREKEEKTMEEERRKQEERARRAEQQQQQQRQLKPVSGAKEQQKSGERQAQRPPEEKKKLNLDFPGDYGDDSDDD